MNRFASHNPELYEQMVRDHGSVEEAFRANADVIRQRQKDEPPMCRICSELPITDTLRGVCTRCAKALDDERERDY